MVSIRTEEITKRFGDVVALDGVSLNVREGEFFALLGPSGCGKTTLLRVIAGLERQDEGRVYFDGRDVSDLPPHERRVAMVFQNYALWPHMTVFDNVAYGLKLKGLPKEEIAEKVRWALRLVRLEGMEDRTPFQLSGGQQQRVALARALAVEPEALLLDEPLSNLDAKLRLEMRGELRKLQRELGVTAVYVTHDQEEAMSLADRIAVMNRGRILQVGTPAEIYERPANYFVADFIGQSTFIPGTVRSASGEVYEVETNLGVMRAVPSTPGSDFHPGEEVILAVRPENLRLGCGRGSNEVEVKVVHVAYLGKHLRLLGEADGIRVVAELDKDSEVGSGETVRLCADPEDVLIIRRS